MNSEYIKQQIAGGCTNIIIYFSDARARMFRFNSLSNRKHRPILVGWICVWEIEREKVRCEWLGTSVTNKVSVRTTRNADDLVDGKPTRTECSAVVFTVFAVCVCWRQQNGVAGCVNGVRRWWESFASAVCSHVCFAYMPLSRCTMGAMRRGALCIRGMRRNGRLRPNGNNVIWWWECVVLFVFGIVWLFGGASSAQDSVTRRRQTLNEIIFHTD